MHAYSPSLQKPEAIEKRVLITGAGRGLGRAIAEAFLEAGFFVLANLTKFFTPLMPDGQGRFIAIGSESYRVPAPFQPYAVSKQALEAVYRAIKTELSPGTGLSL